MTQRIWTMPEGGGGVYEISMSEARYANEDQKLGIFHTWNDYQGTRLVENVTKINAWAVDIDGADKHAKALRITQSPIKPSSIVETKNGFHAYFFAKDSTVKNFKKVMLGLQEFFGADKRALDSARILRLPGYWHQKTEDKFLIEEIFKQKVFYREIELLKAFPAKQAIEVYTEDEALFRDHATGGDLWDVIYNLDCKVALERISGTPVVNGQKFTFARVRNGHNIIVDGKGTSCWVDRAGRIGSATNGGPTIFRWINWYSQNKKQTIAYMKEFFPELPWRQNV